MLDLSGIEEYNNSGALLGLDGIEQEEFLGALKRMNPVQRMRVINKMAGGVPASRGSRAEMEKHFSELPDHIRQGLLNNELRLADTIIYSRKKVSSKTVKMFETQDVKATGLRNISNAVLPKNQALLVSGIFLLAGVAAAPTDDSALFARYEKIEDFPAIANGEFSLKANKKIILNEVENSVFKTFNNHQIPIGYYKLANPRLIQDDVQIEATIELGSTEGLDTTRTYLYLGLHGTITTP